MCPSFVTKLVLSLKSYRMKGIYTFKDIFKGQLKGAGGHGSCGGAGAAGEWLSAQRVVQAPCVHCAPAQAPCPVPSPGARGTRPRPGTSPGSGLLFPFLSSPIAPSQTLFSNLGPSSAHGGGRPAAPVTGLCWNIISVGPLPGRL